MSLNLRNTIVAFLKERPEERFTARQIAQWIFANYREDCENKRARSKQDLSDDESFLLQLVAEISSNRPDIQHRHPEIKTTESRPRRYFYSTNSDEAEASQIEYVITSAVITTETTNNQPEHQLYPLLAKYLYSSWGIYSKRIDEKRASNRRGQNGNKWLFPDLVGIEDLSTDWNSEVKGCVSHYRDKWARLWSFEVKVELNRNTVREAWFQAVSNSSWANFGYLVARDVIGDDTMKELRMLSAAHGIGLIRLDVEDPNESQILIPAMERSRIDWDACNRLAIENADFMLFIKHVRQFHQTGELRAADWDIERSR